MTDINFISALLIGVAGGVHCVGMCGGIVGAFNYAIPKNAQLLPYVLSYNIGRILSYSLAGALTGWLGYMFANQVNKGLLVLHFISGLFLLALGLFIGGWWQGLAKIEQVGSRFWQRIRPWSKQFIPFKHPLYALPYGALWGWLPCGLVYSVLTWSLASGSAQNGAKIMLGFGLGTLPIMLLMAMGFKQLQASLQSSLVRKLLGCLLILFAGFYLWQAIQQSVANNTYPY